MGLRSKRNIGYRISRKLNFETVVVTEVTPEAHIYAQHVDEGPKLDSLVNQLREEFSRNPPLAGAFTPKRGACQDMSF